MNDTIKVCIIEDDEKYHKIVKDLLKKYGMKNNVNFNGSPNFRGVRVVKKA